MAEPTILRLSDPSDSLKMIRETLSAVQNGAAGLTRYEHAARIGRIIAEIDRQRPLGPNGKHGNLHTPTCGCDVGQSPAPTDPVVAEQSALAEWDVAAMVAGLRAAADSPRDQVAITRQRLVEAADALEAASSCAEPQDDDEPCGDELWSWHYFQPEQVDPYWMRCDRIGPHDEHKNSETGAHWAFKQDGGK